MREKITSFFAVMILLIGLSLLLYPTVSNYIHTESQHRVIYDYLQSVEELSDDEYQQLIEEAQAHNERLARNSLYLQLYDKELRESYFKCLDVTGTGLMGNISIEKGNIYLPIYHTSAESVLQVGVGHIEGSSLPIGGETAHTLLTGHRGLPSAMLFTNLDKLELGDTFTLMVLNEPYVYEVDHIQIILPEQGDILQFEQGQDYCTLITCTPYGINTHRLLVRGKRLALSVEDEKMSVQTGARMVKSYWLIAIVEVPVLIVSAIIATAVERRRYRKAMNRR